VIVSLTAFDADSLAWRMIYIPATNKVYDTFAHPAFCMQLHMDKAKTLSSPLQPAPGVKIEKNPIGNEEIEGHKCTVQDVLLKSLDGDELHAKVWEANDLMGFPVKIEASGSPTFIFRDILLATPDPALFQPQKPILESPSSFPRAEELRALAVIPL